MLLSYMFCQTWKLTTCCGGDIVQISLNSHDYFTDLSGVLITFVFVNSLIRTSFEAKVIEWNWVLKTMLFFRIFWLYVQTMSSYHNSTAFYKKLTGTDLGYSSDEDE